MTARGGYSVIAVLGLGMAMPVGGVAAVRDRVTLPEGEQAIVRRVMSASDEIDAAQAKLRDRVSVLDYAGRVRLTNDVEVWSDAIAAALAEHETVVMPGGRTYVLDRTIVMPSNRRLEATGATVRLLAPAEVFVRTATDADGTLAPSVKPRGDNISVVGGRWCDWCTSRRQGIVPPPPVGEFHGMRAAFYLGNADHLAIEKVTVENAGGFGIQIDNADAVRLTGIRFERCRADGIHVDGNVSRIWIRDVRGEVDDDFVAFNGYDWLLGSVNFGPQRDILCEDVVPVDDVRHGYPSIRLLQGIYRYADGSKVDCRLSNAVFRNIRKVLTFKAYLHTQFFVIGEEPEFSEVGTIENIWFDDIDIDLVRPIDGKERCGLTVYSDSDPVRGHFAAFEFGTNADGVHFRNVKVRLHPDKWPLSHFMTVGPKSATFRRPNDGKTIEVFDPNVSCLVRGVTLENVSIEGAPSDRHFHETTFDDVNRDGRSSGRGRLEPPQTSSASGATPTARTTCRLGLVREGRRICRGRDVGRRDGEVAPADDEVRAFLHLRRTLERVLHAFRSQARDGDETARPLTGVNEKCQTVTGCRTIIVRTLR